MLGPLVMWVALFGSSLSACGGRQPCAGPVHEIERGAPAASASDTPR